MIQLELLEDDELNITTCGSAFDTYLCLYEDGCCEDGTLISFNNNNTVLCGGNPLQAGLNVVLSAGTYYLVLDGAYPASAGSYCLTIDFLGFGGGEPENR